MEFFAILSKAGVALLAIAMMLIAVVGAAFIFLFRREIAGVLNRWMPRAGDRTTSPPLQGTESITKLSGEQEPLLNSKLPHDPSLLVWERRIDGELEKFSKDEHVERLKRALAMHVRAAAFKEVGRQIYGSQVHALTVMRSGNGIDTDSLREVFKEHQLRVLQDPVTANTPTEFLKWLSFLTYFELIELEGGEYKLTEIGEQLVSYLHESGIKEDAPY